MTDLGTVLAIGSAMLGGSGVVAVWLVRIEHRLTRLETTIKERMPRPHDTLS